MCTENLRIFAASLAAILLFAVPVAAYPVLVDSWVERAELIADDGEPSDHFGVSVALSGDSALVGAYRAAAGGDSSPGAAYVFTRSDGVWSQQAKLVADDGEAGDWFGYSVALAGDTALVGAVGATVGDNLDQGAAYVFTRSDGVWSQQAKLNADDGAAGDWLGTSAALAGDTALVGAVQGGIPSPPSTGAAWVFTRSDGEWSQQAKLTADDGTATDWFGVSVALEGDSALVGSYHSDVDGNFDQGAAYLFSRSGGVWSQQLKLAADDGADFDFFGKSVALAGDTALVGADYDDGDGNFNQGAAYVFVPPLTPAPLAVDPEPTVSADGNGVFEPGETVDVAPAWRNNGTAPLSGLTGTASGFAGPPGATYTLAQDSADYGTLDPDQIASCLDTGTCYAMGLDDPARPATHWDATFGETLDDSDGTARTWTLHIGDSFSDVPRSSLFYSWIETLLHSGVTGGCGAGDAYCPGSANTRAQMPVFMLRALLGADYTPPTCVEGASPFDDVPFDNAFCPWIQELANRGIVSGCGGDNYCPNAPVTRAQMAIFLIRTLAGAGYEPPACTGEFADVPCPSLFAGWIEELAARGITGGCEPTTYCPGAAVARAQMAVFISRAFGLTLHEP